MVVLIAGVLAFSLESTSEDATQNPGRQEDDQREKEAGFEPEPGDREKRVHRVSLHVNRVIDENNDMPAFFF